jgi:hypothetical protein
MSEMAMLCQPLRAIIFESGTTAICEGNFWLFNVRMIAGVHNPGASSCTTQFQFVSESIEMPAVGGALCNFQFERDALFFAGRNLPDRMV